jgi:hypothetical protein
MNCRHLENNLFGYIESSLTPSLMLEVKEHIEDCEACKQIYLQVKCTYEVFNVHRTMPVPDLYPGILQKLKYHHVSVVEFVPRHRVIYRVAASIIVIIGVGIGIFVGGKYSSIKNSNTQSFVSQSNSGDEVSESYSTLVNSMDGESGLAMLYTNE